MADIDYLALILGPQDTRATSGVPSMAHRDYLKSRYTEFFAPNVQVASKNSPRKKKEVCILACCMLIKIAWLKWILSALFFGLSVFITYFFRVPRRQEAGNGTLVSSVADGKVVILEKVFEKEYLKRDCIQVSVYMDFFDVHVNFWPVTGEVT